MRWYHRLLTSLVCVVAGVASIAVAISNGSLADFFLVSLMSIGIVLLVMAFAIWLYEPEVYGTEDSYIAETPKAEGEWTDDGRSRTEVNQIVLERERRDTRDTREGLYPTVWPFLKR